MAYTKQTWQIGDTITADKLNHIEDGIAEGGSGGGIFVVNFTYDEQTNKFTADKTIQEINTAAVSGPVIGHIEFGGSGEPTYVLGGAATLQFICIYTSGDTGTGAIEVLEAEFDEGTHEPTGFWTLADYIFDITIPT